ncbi:MAG: YtxH domain-containing protein [Candidatus Saccharimonadales bacterium]
MSKKSNFALGAIVVGIFSFVAGILTAPKSGRETRKDIKNAARKAKLDAERKLKQVHSELSKVIDEATEKLEKSKSKVDEGFKLAVQAAIQVKQKTRELISAAHEGESDDKELQNAIEDVKKASAHLKSYLEKKETTK